MSSTHKYMYDLERTLFVFLIPFGLLIASSSSYAHSGPMNKLALEVCEKKEKSQACQYEDGHSNLFIGSCQYISEKDLICVRNKPIQKVETEKTETEEDLGHNHKHTK